MDTEQKWTISEDVLKEAFGELGIDDVYYPIFKVKAITCLNEIAKEFEPEEPDPEHYDNSVDIACSFIKHYVSQIKFGLPELWAKTFADNRISWSVDESAHEAYNLVCEVKGQDQADKDLSLFAQFLSDDPKFVETYHSFFKKYVSIEDTLEYLRIYDSLIEKGKSTIYAKQYALRRLEEIDPEFCDLYASKYEECINKGRNEEDADTIATAYEELYEDYWPEDDNILGIEGHKAYMTGYEYAIDNNLESPHFFAEEYEKEAIARLFPDAKEPPCKVKGKYDDLIKELYPIK